MERIERSARSSAWPPSSQSRSAGSGQCRKRSAERYRLGAHSRKRGGQLDANRLSQGQLVAAIAAIVLFIISFLPWFGVSGAVTGGGTTIGGSTNFSLWEAENPLDIYLLIVILVALTPAVLSLMGDGGDAPMASMATTLLAGVGTLLILYQVFDTPGDAGRKIGLFLGLIACAGIAVGGYLTMQETSGGERY